MNGAQGIRFFMKDGQLIMATPNKPDAVATQKDTDENVAAYRLWLDSDEWKAAEAKADAERVRAEREAAQLKDGGEGDGKKK